jgi:outer membrane lipoprotein-sorting protein
MSSIFPGRRKFLLAAAALAVAGRPLVARAAREPSSADQADIKRVEDYLNGVTTLRAHFLQIDSQGGTAEGTLYLDRPGRLRVDYTPPNPNLLIANYGLLLHYDRQLKTTAYLPLSSTPAGLLVRPHLSLSGDVTVLGVTRGPAVLRVTVDQTTDPRAGQVTFVFGERPFVLNSWDVTDAQGAKTKVTLYDVESGIALDSKLFQFPGGAPPANGGAQ